MRRPEPTDHFAGPTLSEAQLKARVVELAHAAGWRVFSLPMIKNLRPVRNGASGYPDLTLARHREVRFLECKADKGQLSDDQRAWLDALPDAHVIGPADLNNGRLVRLLV